MDINLKKTKSMCFNLNAINLIYDNVLIEHITQFKLLGMLIDSKLSFRNNCDIIDRKLNSYFLFFYKIRHLLTKNSKLMIYNAFIQSIIYYGSVIYGNFCPNSINKINNIQNKLISTLFGTYST